MNSPFFKQTVTLFLLNKNTDSYDRLVINNVYFRYADSNTMTGEGIVRNSRGTISISSQYSKINDNYALASYNGQNTILEFVLEGILADTMWNLKNNSYVVDGEYYDNITSLVDLKDIPFFRIKSVQDNRKGKLQHIKLEVAE